MLNTQAPVFHSRKAGQDLLDLWPSNPCSDHSPPLQETWTATIEMFTKFGDDGYLIHLDNARG